MTASFRAVRRSAASAFRRGSLPTALGVAVAALALGPPRAAAAVDSSAAAARAALEAWVQARWSDDPTQAPFRFTFGGRPSVELLPQWERSTEVVADEPQRIATRRTYRDPASGLEVRAEAIVYRDFPTVEWTLFFENRGDRDTPLVEDIQVLDAAWRRPGAAEFVLHHHKGARATPTDFRPFATELSEGTELRLASLGGRGTNGGWPYFNVQHEGGGLIAAIGWPGQWAARFVRNYGDQLRIQAGQELTRFKIRPGERFRSPLAVLQFYAGRPDDAQNVWRRWMVAHNLPRVGGEPPPTQLVACSSHQFGEMIRANEENQKLFIDRYVEERLGISHWWMDAGWYVNDGTWINTGTWEVDRQRFPRGLRAITDHGRARGVKSIVWFEPERVTRNSWLFQNRPEWLLSPPPNPGDQLYDPQWLLLDLGNPEALAWLIDRVSGLLSSEGVDLYRQDFNLDPLLFWRARDAEDRQGVTEIRHVEGYLKYWDELRRRHPGLRIDTCASGGRRLDLETLRRSVPQVRSDYLFEPTGQQCHAYGISSWLPYHGTGTLIGASAIGQNTTEELSVYDFRSHMAASVTACWDMRRTDLDYDALRRLTTQMREAAPNFLGDFYPLTPYSDRSDAWIAWQYDRPEQGSGVVQAFRRENSGESRRQLTLRGLDPAAEYDVRDADEEQPVRMSGASLLHQGVTVALPAPRSAALVFYAKAADRP